MLAYNPATRESGCCIVTGRGAAAIGLALSAIGAQGGRVLFPANICYAAVLPALYHGFAAAFCDVDAASGNVTRALVEAALTEDTVAAVIPHMYGNPVADLPEIAGLLRARGVVLIEDCASLMARDAAGCLPGTVGDYVVYSTGYSKTIDNGIGGLLFSKRHDLSALEKTQRALPPFREEFEEIWSNFSRTYRVLRNEGQNTPQAREVYARLPERFRESFSFSVDAEMEGRILASIERLDEVIAERRRQCALYRSCLDLPEERMYVFSPDAVPWRFNLYVGQERAAFIRHCLEQGLPVSDWYPAVTPIFRCDAPFPGAQAHEKKIINFPLLIPDERIREICAVVRAFYA